VGSVAEPQPKSKFVHFSLKIASNNFNYIAENQLTKFSARDAGDFNDAAGEH